MNIRKRKYRKKAAAMAVVCTVMILTGCGSSAGAVTENADGTYTVEESAECDVPEQDISYTVFLKVTTDKDGTIVSVEDDGTQIPDGKEGAYKSAQAIFEELAGKNADTISNVDIVSGATASSEAILSAAEQALKDIN